MAEKLCGCKGIRFCKLCEVKDVNISPVCKDNVNRPFQLCTTCATAYRDQNGHTCGEKNVEEFSFANVSVFDNFVTEEEELSLVKNMDGDNWNLSQSGRRKQDFGPKVNFKRKRVVYGQFSGLPAYSQPLVDRINEAILSHSQTQKTTFHPVELCNLEYEPDRGACIIPHLDDTWLWGDRLVTLNLCSPTVLTFTLPDNQSMEVCGEYERVCRSLAAEPERIRLTDLAVRVPLPTRSLVIVDGPARYVWFHSIQRPDIQSRRVAMTFRELSNQFLPSSSAVQTEDRILGQKLLEIAKTYTGVTC